MSIVQMEVHLIISYFGLSEATSFKFWLSLVSGMLFKCYFVIILFQSVCLFDCLMLE